MAKKFSPFTTMQDDGGDIVNACIMLAGFKIKK